LASRCEVLKKFQRLLPKVAAAVRAGQAGDVHENAGGAAVELRSQVHRAVNIAALQWLCHLQRRGRPADDRPRMIDRVNWYRRTLVQNLIAPVCFIVLTFAMFGGVLFQTERLPAADDTDLLLQFVPWRAFGFGQLRHGHLPLWNPYIYGGTPYFGGFQSALLYPLNWLHLVLPLNVAITWICAIHVFLAGYFTSLWARARGAGVAGSILAGSMFMFGGTYFLHVYAGHLPHICVMIWLPLLFLTIERLARSGSLNWCWLGVIVMSLIILAGHPQYVYYTGIITVLYTLLLLPGCVSKPKLIAGYTIILIVACGLTAVQLLSGLQAAGESVRSGGTSYDFASMFGFPPENLLTFLVPDFFGRLPTFSNPHPAVPYFGRCYLWEMSVFVSISGLVLACFAMVVDWRMHWRAIVIIAIALVLALGKHLSIYQLLFNDLPMYASFRGASKFTVFLTLFLSVLAADGYELLIKKGDGSRWIIFPAAVLAVAAAAFAWAFCISGDSFTWRQLMLLIRDSVESYSPSERYLDPSFTAIASSAAMQSTIVAGCVLVFIAGIITATHFWKRAAPALVVLGVLESFIVARQSYTNGLGQVPMPEPWTQAIDHSLGDGRVLNGAIPGNQELQYLNLGMLRGFRDIWGYDPGVLKRYAELLASSQHIDPARANQYLSFAGATQGLLRLLRCSLVLYVENGKAKAVQIIAPLPRASLIPNWSLSTTRGETLDAINAPNFDPRQRVLLESPPPVLPRGDATGTADVVDIDSDTLDIHAQCDAPTLLLITENYSTGWDATAWDSSGASQSRYDILPADHALMAIPLESGTHHIRLHYRPSAFTIGAFISVISVLGYVIAGGWTLKRHRERHR
jgi:hypothetical protein